MHSVVRARAAETDPLCFSHFCWKLGWETVLMPIVSLELQKFKQHKKLKSACLFPTRLWYF